MPWKYSLYCILFGWKMELKLGQRLKCPWFVFCSFPNDIAAITNDENEMRATIRTTVINLYALRPHTFTPHMAFETIVKEEILRLKNPIHACIDAVVKQLSDSIRLCVNNVSIVVTQ